MRKHKSIKMQYDFIGEDFLNAQEEFFKKHKDFARAYIKSKLDNVKKKTLVDIGCGGGFDILEYEKMGFRKVFGVDPSTKMVLKARTLVKNPANIKIGDYENTGLKNSSADYVIGRYSLHYLKNFGLTYKEIARILKPKGILILAVDHPTASRLGKKLFRRHGWIYVRVSKFYGKSINIEFPLHEFSDYFSKTFLKLFDIIEIKEDVGKDLEYQSGPNSLVFTARKR